MCLWNQTNVTSGGLMISSRNIHSGVYLTVLNGNIFLLFMEYAFSVLSTCVCPPV